MEVGHVGINVRKAKGRFAFPEGSLGLCEGSLGLCEGSRHCDLCDLCDFFYNNGWGVLFIYRLKAFQFFGRGYKN